MHHLLILHHNKSFSLAHWFCLFNLTLLNLVQSFILKPQRLRLKDSWRISLVTNIENSSIWESGILVNLVYLLEYNYFHGDWRYLKNFSRVMYYYFSCLIINLLITLHASLPKTIVVSSSQTCYWSLLIYFAYIIKNPRDSVAC